MSRGMWILYAVVIAIVVVFYIAAMWMVFKKAGRPGWAAIIPFFNMYVLLQIAGKPGWWLILFFIPLVNVVVQILMQIGVAEKFGKGGGYAVGLIFLPFIFYPLLGFGDAKYQA
jgi:hypothetical protein